MKGTADRPLVRDRHQPRALRLEILGEPAARFRPRHPGDHDAALRAVHARHGGDQFDPSSSRNPGHTSSARRRPGHTRGASFRSGSIGACPRTWAHMDLEDGSGAQWRVDDARVLDTVFLTLRSRLNILFIRRFAVVCLSWSKTSYPESALLLLPQQLNGETHPRKQQ